MTNPNDQLIQKVFDAMSRQRPSLNRFVAVGDDDFEEDVDLRILGDQVIKSFPWPIGVEVRRLFSASCRNIDRNRLDQTFKTAERTMQFIGYVLLSQLFDATQKGNLKVSDNFKEQFQKRFSVMSLGNFTWLVRDSLKLLEENNLSPFVDELSGVADKDFLKRLEEWVPLRNAISHYQVNMPDEEVEKKCVETQDLLEQLLCDLSFLANYRLVSIRQIQVIKLRNEDARYLHVIDLLNNSDSDFKGKNIEEQVHTDSNAVILTKNLKSLRQFLNLSPLVIDTHGEVISSRDKFHLRKDVFLYSKFKNDHIMYVGTETTDKCDLRALSNYPQLLDEYKLLVQLLS